MVSKGSLLIVDMGLHWWRFRRGKVLIHELEHDVWFAHGNLIIKLVIQLANFSGMHPTSRGERGGAGGKTAIARVAVRIGFVPAVSPPG